MSKQQFMSTPIGKRTPQSQYENPLFTASKEELFSVHLSKLNRSRQDICKQSSITLSSQYQRTFEQYTKSMSLIDRITETFDNGNIADLFHQRPKFVQSEVFMHLQAKNRETVKEINQLFFNNGKVDEYCFDEPLTSEHYSKMLVNLKQKTVQFEQIKQIRLNAQPENQKNAIARSQTVATHNPIDSKVDLLLNEIVFQKKRSDCPLYFQAMEIKLTQFIDYVIGDDDRYIGMSLKDKAQQILREINSFKGRRTDGWLTLVLIDIFFQEFKELQTLKVAMLRMQKKSQEQKHQIRSEADVKSQKSNNSSIRKGKYSEPNSHRNNIKEEQWIGALK